VMNELKLVMNELELGSGSLELGSFTPIFGTICFVNILIVYEQFCNNVKVC
jgi:hypothetical protein